MSTMIIDDDHMEHLIFSEKGIPHPYVPGHALNLAFLGSNSAGDWAVGDFWGPLGNETRAWLDFLSTGRPSVHATPEQAMLNLKTTSPSSARSRPGKRWGWISVPAPESAEAGRNILMVLTDREMFRMTHWSALPPLSADKPTVTLVYGTNIVGNCGCPLLGKHAKLYRVLRDDGATKTMSSLACRGGAAPRGSSFAHLKELGSARKSASQ